jgi:zinc protease
VAAVQLWVRVGARHEGPGEGGLSHFVEHLLFKGTPTRGPGVIDRTISERGGEMNAATSQDFTYYHVVLPSRHVGTAIDVVADAARRAALEAEELDRERLVVLRDPPRADNPPPELAAPGRPPLRWAPGAEPARPAETIRALPRAVLAYFGGTTRRRRAGGGRERRRRAIQAS